MAPAGRSVDGQQVHVWRVERSRAARRRCRKGAGEGSRFHGFDGTRNAEPPGAMTAGGSVREVRESGARHSARTGQAGVGVAGMSAAAGRSVAGDRKPSP